MREDGLTPLKNGSKLRVLHLTTHLDPGGITSYIRLLARTMAAAGHQSVVLSGGGASRGDFARDGIETCVFPIRTKNEFHPKLFLAARAIAQVVREGRFSVLHAHSRVTQVLASLVSGFSGVPSVSTAHGYFKPNVGRRLFDGWGSRVIAISPAVADDLESSHGISSDRIRVVLNAIDQPSLEKRFSRLNTEEAKRIFSLEGRFPVLASVGRLVEDKGHAYLIDAAAVLKKDFPNLFLILVGEGREKQKLQKRLTARHLTSSASILGGQLDLAAVYRACDVFVHPATWREGFGLSLAEAMFAEKPIVATRIPALDRLYSDGENALLVPPADSAALMRAIRYLLERPKDAARIAQNGARWARTVCRPERFASEIEAVYREVAGV